MKKNLSYRGRIQRRNLAKDILLSVFLLLSSYPKMLLEVFIRKNFGERYFRFSSAISAAVYFMIVPLIINNMVQWATRGSGGLPEEDFWLHNATNYLFILVFLYFSYKRWQEVKRNPSVFDFEKYSLSSGDIDPRFYEVKFGGTFPDTRRVEILYEPALFFFPGLFLWLIGQNLGILLVVCSIFYSLSYWKAYLDGDDFVMDKIDELIMNEVMEDDFVLDKPNAKGVEFRMRKPKSHELRMALYDTFIEDEDEVPELVR